MFGGRNFFFQHDLIPATEIRDEIVDGKRFYDTPDGRFKSVTTIIGESKGDQWKIDWEKRVGADKVKEVGGKARVRGRAFHEICEKFVLNDPRWAEGMMPSNLYSFKGIRDILEQRIGVVRAVEYPLWSARLKTAGRTDLVAEFDGVLSIVDFKTSLRPKTEDKIHGYLIQKTCYGEMLLERTGVDAPQIVTIMSVDHDEPMVWVRQRKNFVHEMEQIFMGS